MRYFLFLMVAFCSFIANANADPALTCQQHQCLAVVDAGSSGSRVYIYAYDLDSNNNPMQINELWSKKIKPGFATLDLNQDTINNYLDNLFSTAPAQNMPVYFYATAGMRLLPQPKQRLYYEVVEQWFAAQTQWQLADSKTITGSEEGVYGWLAVNYQLGNFNSTDKPLASVMDMGGASVQVTFPVKNVRKIDRHDLVAVDVSGQHIVLFVHSFLGLGQTLLSQQFLDEESCYAAGYQLPGGIQANGDASTCQRKVSKLINKVHEINHIVKPVLSRNPANTWYAMGGVASIAQDHPFSFENQQFTSHSLLEQADTEVCHQQWQDLYGQYPTNDYLYGYCLFPAYYYALMVDGYGIQPGHPINYIPSGQGADWSLGVVLHHH